MVKARNMIRIKSFAQRRLKRHGNADNEIMSNSLSAEEIDTTRLATLGNDTICFVSSSI
ncbi:MAG: hypothetical protein E6246_06045 [Veillonella sp.]|nr:hypothetical protein [Veillonella sp.]